MKFLILLRIQSSYSTTHAGCHHACHFSNITYLFRKHGKPSSIIRYNRFIIHSPILSHFAKGGLPFYRTTLSFFFNGFFGFQLALSDSTTRTFFVLEDVCSVNDDGECYRRRIPLF